MNQSDQLNMRVSLDDHESWRIAANIKKKKKAAWIRETLNAAAAKIIEHEKIKKPIR